MATHITPRGDPPKPQPVPSRQSNDWTKPAAMAIPKEGYFEFQQGNFGPVFPRTPACYGFSILAKVKPGREDAFREYSKVFEKAIQNDPSCLTPLKLHYMKWVLFDIGNEKFFMHQGIFDTDFDKFPYDAVAIFNQLGLSTSFENLEGFPEDWKTRPEGFIQFMRDHHCPSFLEYGEYPYVTADEVKKALKLKKAFSEALDQMQ